MNRNGKASTRRGNWIALIALVAVSLASAGCGDGGDDVTAPPPIVVPSVSGTVRSAATSEPVADAQVTLGDRIVTTGADGRFEFAQATPGSAVLRCVVTGFEDFEADITIPQEGLDHDIALSRIELFEFGDFALFVPATVSSVRGILVTLGGPDTRGFASESTFGAPVPETEAALQELGADFRILAAQRGLAVLGTSLSALSDGDSSDEVLRLAIDQAAALSGRPELSDSPLLVYGISGGGPEASGLTARNPERVAGLFLRVPESAESVTDGPVLEVPTYMVLAELDAFVDNDALEATFLGNRAAGALWALAMERGVIHFALTPAQRALTINWMSEILTLRLGAEGTSSLRSINPILGWLGDPVSGYVATWTDYLGDRASASWFPSAESGSEWSAFTEAGAPPVSSVTIDPGTPSLALGSTRLVEVAARDADGERIRAAGQFSSDNESVVKIWDDPICRPKCGHILVIAVGPGTTRISASYEGITASAEVVVTLDEEGLYFLEAAITGNDPAWGDLSGYGFTAILRLEVDPAVSAGIGGTFVEFRATAPTGASSLMGLGWGTITCYLIGEDIVIEAAGFNFFPQSPFLVDGFLPPVLEGSFIMPLAEGQFSGPFTARNWSQQ